MKQARVLTPAPAPAPKRRRAAAPRIEPAAPTAAVTAPFRYLVFTDVHADLARLDRVLMVLDRVNALAREHNAMPVCLGDFWHLRGHWLVRHVDAVLRKLQEWEGGIFIPGNHDQVSLDGQIHGMNIFRTLPGFQVATNEILDVEKRIAFLPWRERPEDQRALFQLEGRPWTGDDPWTIFAHAEVGGAETNGGHRAPGIVQVEDIEKVARACYLGHYHKRQQLGNRSWYIGSPFAQDMGERDWPHGVALVTSERVEPEFIELNGFPKYWRFGWRDEIDHDQIDPDDVVELIAPAADIGTPAYRRIVDALPAADVRPVVEREAADTAAPEFALTLDSAIELYGTERGEDLPIASEENTRALIELGRRILGEIPEARALMPLGTEVRLKRVQTRDFCALRGELDVPVGDWHLALIQAPVATGKTALLDAPGWCLYDTTTPRKAGQQGATLRADGVIHDDASDCLVACTFDVSGREVVITRTKRRGQGSRVTVTGIEHPDGISDGAALVQHVIGLSQPLWRACVGLGQGAVANFATDADKRRKDLLNEAFGLESCPKAQKRAKQLRDKASAEVAALNTDIASKQGALDALVTQDFSAQSGEWEKRRGASVDVLQREASVALAKAQQCETLLAGEEAWQDTKRRHDAHVDAMTKRLTALRPTVRIAELQRQFGSVEAEKALATREVGLATAHYTQLVSSGETATCSACGQLLPVVSREQHIADAERRVRNAQAQVSTLGHRQANIAEELDRLNSGGDAEQKTIEASIAESRTALVQCNEAVSQFARLRANLDAARVQHAEALRRVEAEQAAVNPFEQQSRQVAERIAQLQIALDERTAAVGAAMAELARYEIWVDGFGPKGIPVLVLRTALYDLEVAANRYLNELLAGTVFCQLGMVDDDLTIKYFETMRDGATHEREYEQLSGGQRRCVELAFAPFALSDMIFARRGVRVSLLLIDELTTHMGAEEKIRACGLLDHVARDTVLVVDHDVTVQGHFDTKLTLTPGPSGMSLEPE